MSNNIIISTVACMNKRYFGMIVSESECYKTTYVVTCFDTLSVCFVFLF